MSNPIILNEKDGSSFEQQEGDTLLRAALRAGVGLSYECNSGGCGGCKFELLQGEVETLWADAPGLNERDKRRGRHLACQCRAKGPVSIKASTGKEYVPKVVPQRHKAQLVGSSDITHDLREFRFRSTGGANFLPGQFAMLDLAGLDASRAYSLSNTANDDGEWHFQVRRVPHGKGTHVLFDKLACGDEIGLDGPYGVAWLRTESPRDIVCVAGGSGLAPMVSIARGADPFRSGRARRPTGFRPRLAAARTCSRRSPPSCTRRTGRPRPARRRAAGCRPLAARSSNRLFR